MNETPSRASSPRLRALALFSIIFIAGGVTGAALTLALGRQALQRFASDPAAWSSESIRRLDRRLHLAPEQRASVHPVLEKMATRLRETRRESRSAAAAAIREARQELLDDLSSEQLAAFDRLTTPRHTRRHSPRPTDSP